MIICLVTGIPNPDAENTYDEYDYEYEEESVCLTSVESVDPEKECIFPFTFNNFTYNGCPSDPLDNTKRWCSTKTDKDGLHRSGSDNWGYCTSGCYPEVFPGNILECITYLKSVSMKTANRSRSGLSIKGILL